MLPRGIAPPLDGAFIGVTPVSLEIKLQIFPPAKPAN